MADENILTLTEETSPAATDLMYLVDDPAGTPADRKVQVGSLLSVGYSWVTLLIPFDGTLTTTTGLFRLAAPCTLTIDHVYLTCSTAPTGAAIIVDVNKNETTIFTTQANRPQIAASAYAGTSTTPDVTSLVLNDYLTADIDQIGSTVAGANLLVHVRCKQYHTS